MNKICTSIKQSRRLIELGIDINTADMCYMYRHWEIDENTIGSQSDASIGFNLDFYYGADNGKTYHYIPAWSLTVLLEIIPKKIKDFNVIRMDIGEDTFAMWYDEIGYGVNRELPNIEMNEPVNVCVEIIIKLKEINLL